MTLSGDDPMRPIRASDLADRPDFMLGSATISPSSRTVKGPGLSADVEPRVMQVLVALAEARGQVVSRESLFDRCWGGVVVGDDSLNRAVAGVRKIGTDIASGSFTVETIPRTGYRLIAGRDDRQVATGSPPATEGRTAMSRRAVAGTVAGTALLAAGAGFWWLDRNRNGDFDRLMRDGQDALDYADGSDRAASLFQRAAALHPDSADAQGKLAYALTVNANRVNPGANGRGAMDRPADAAHASLAMDPRNIYARLAQVELDQASLDMTQTDVRLGMLLAEAPRNNDVLRGMWSLRQSAGLSRDALALVQRAMTLKPLTAGNNYPLGQLLWINGQNAEADRILERAIDYWPDHPFVRFARFNLLAYTGRARLAAAMVENPSTRPQPFGPPSVALWRIALKALDDPTPANISAATKASLDGVAEFPQLTPQAVMSLATLGQIDAAFDIANQLLQFRATGGRSKRKNGSSVAWRFAPWLFTPPAQPMQRDPRFIEICDATGLTAYWAKRKVRPDFMARSA